MTFFHTGLTIIYRNENNSWRLVIVVRGNPFWIFTCRINSKHHTQHKTHETKRHGPFLFHFRPKVSLHILEKYQKVLCAISLTSPTPKGGRPHPLPGPPSWQKRMLFLPPRLLTVWSTTLTTRLTGFCTIDNQRVTFCFAQ